MGLNKALAFSCMSLTLACAGAAKADTFSTGQFVTFDQNDWGSGVVASSILTSGYNTVFASNNGVLTVGVVGTPGQFFMAFTGANDVVAFLPEVGPSGPLIDSLLNPINAPSELFGGDTVALALNIDFNNAGLLGSTSSIPFDDLVLANLPTFDAALNGLTVSQFLGIANTCLGGGSCGTSGLDNVAAITDDLNIAFDGGTPDAFADDHLFLPSSGTPAPEPSSLLLLASALVGLAFLRRRRILRE